MIRTTLLRIVVWIVVVPFAYAADDPTVEELWVRRYSSEAAWDRLLELGPETRELARRILHPPGEVFAKWPTSGDSALIESMRADAVPEIIRSLRDSVDTDDRVTMMRQLESLGCMARPAAEALMTIALEADGSEREAALRALAATGAKRDFLIGEAIHMLSVAGSSRSVRTPMVGPDHVALVGTWLLRNLQDDRARTALVRAARFHPSASVRESAVSSLSYSARTDSMLFRNFIDCLEDHSATGSGFAGAGSPSSEAYRAILQYHELPASAATGLIERLYSQSYEESSEYELSLVEAIVKCPATDTHASELVQRKIRPLLNDESTDWSEVDRVLGPRTAKLVDIDEVLKELRDPQFVLDNSRWEDSESTWMLLRAHHDVIIPVLRGYLKSERIDVRIATLGILGHKEFAPDTVIPNIVELLDDRYASVRAAAAEALADFGPAAAAAIPKLERATQDEYLTMKLAAEDALSAIREAAK